LKKYTAAFIAAAAVFSALLQASFGYIYSKNSSLARFIFARKVIEKSSRLASGTAPSYMNFTAGMTTAILALPSCGANLAPVPGSFDYFVMSSDAGTAVFSMYPAAESARKHGSMFMKDIAGMKFTASGSLFGFSGAFGGPGLSRNFYMEKSLTLLPSSTEAF
jgi:hypothetical protein